MRITEWDDQRQKIFQDRYALRDELGNRVEHEPDQMFRRVANCLGKSQVERTDFFDAMSSFAFLPSGRILTNAGKEAWRSRHAGTLYNCYVIDLKHPSGADSRGAIMSMASRLIEITSCGGGVGVNWSALRPSGSLARGVDSMSSGPVSWMAGVDALANQVRQGGSRTAALMFMMDVWHPDILTFVETAKFERANFSVNISDAFMSAVERDEDWHLMFPDYQAHGVSHIYDSTWDGDITKWIAQGMPVRVYQTLPARAIWEAITRRAWETGNPGVVFMERCNRQSNTNGIESLVCTNPCGEQPLPAGGACNLGSINLIECADENGRIDWERLRWTAGVAVRMLDRVIDADPGINGEPNASQARTRRIGVGTMGLADLLLLRRERYGRDAIDTINAVYREIADVAYATSARLASIEGAAPAFSHSILSRPFLSTLSGSTLSEIKQYGLRNLSILCQAPTGTTSILAGVSSGIEPVFSPVVIRKDATGVHTMTHPLFIGAGCNPQPHQVTAHDLSIEDHLAVQAAVQRWVDASISKTINLNGTSTAADAEKAFRLAYQSGLKGVTIYRDTGCGVLSAAGSCPTCSI